MKDLEIERVQVNAIGPATTRYAWASDMGEQFTTNTIVRLTTRGGLEGVGAARPIPSTPTTFRWPRL